MRLRKLTLAAVTLMTLTALAQPTAAQTRPWRLYSDAASISRCDLINTANAELVVFDATGEVAIVTAANVIIDGLAIDGSGNVTYFGQPAGIIGFFLDGDGLRSLWWTSLTGQIVSVDGFTGQPTETDEFPIDQTDAGCDACDFVNDDSVCSTDSGNGDPVTVDLCGVAVPLTLNMSLIGLIGMKATRRRRRSFNKPSGEVL